MTKDLYRNIYLLIARNIDEQEALNENMTKDIVATAQFRIRCALRRQIYQLRSGRKKLAELESLLVDFKANVKEPE